MSLVYCKPRGGEGRRGGRKNKMEQQTYPHPPKNKDEAARKPKRTIFRSLIWGEWGSLTFQCIFSKIVSTIFLACFKPPLKITGIYKFYLLFLPSLLTQSACVCFFVVKKACTPSLCLNGGTCVDGSHTNSQYGFACICLNGYDGIICEKQLPQEDTFDQTLVAQWTVLEFQYSIKH